MPTAKGIVKVEHLRCSARLHIVNRPQQVPHVYLGPIDASVVHLSYCVKGSILAQGNDFRARVSIRDFIAR